MEAGRHACAMPASNSGSLAWPSVQGDAGSDGAGDSAAPDWCNQVPTLDEHAGNSSAGGANGANSNTDSSGPPLVDTDAAVPTAGPFDMFAGQSQAEVSLHTAA